MLASGGRGRGGGDGEPGAGNDGRGRGGSGGRGRGGWVGTGRGTGPNPPVAAPLAPAQLIPPMNEQRWQQFRNTIKKSSCNFFEYHRRGLSRDPAAPWDDRTKPPLFQEPAGSSGWDGRYSVDVRATLRAQRRSRVGFERFTGDEGPYMRQKRREAEDAAEVVRARFVRQGATVRLVKVLGFGGNGVASLFEVWPGGDDGPSKKVVVKSLLRRGGNMAAERNYNMVCATFCVQQTGGRTDGAHTSSADEEVLY